jgi:hypothetical protein
MGLADKIRHRIALCRLMALNEDWHTYLRDHKIVLWPRGPKGYPSFSRPLYLYYSEFGDRQLRPVGWTLAYWPFAKEGR